MSYITYVWTRMSRYKIVRYVVIRLPTKITESFSLWVSLNWFAGWSGPIF